MAVVVHVSFRTVVKRCWDSLPERRPEFVVIRRNIDKFYRGSSEKRDDYYSPDEVKREDYYSPDEVTGGEMYINENEYITSS